MFSWCKYLIVKLGISHLGVMNGNLFLIAPFPDRCLLVPFSMTSNQPRHRSVCVSKRVEHCVGIIQLLHSVLQVPCELIVHAGYTICSFTGQIVHGAYCGLHGHCNKLLSVLHNSKKNCIGDRTSFLSFSKISELIDPISCESYLVI